MNELLISTPKQVMAANGKSFYFASFFFSKKRMERIAELYQICRIIDDTADELEPVLAKQEVQKLRQDLRNPDLVSPFQQKIKSVEHYGVSRSHLQELLQGAEFDAFGGRIETQADFLQYCYWVAGVVGLMMCPLLGVRQPSVAAPFAKDLGMAMQMTNICRDVLEDAQRDRIYLPAEMIESLRLQNHLHIQGPTPAPLKKLVAKYLDLADQFYENGYRGLSYLPLRSRLCIVLAGEIYRGIGRKIRRHDFEVLSGRTYLSFGEKMQIALKSLKFLFRPQFWRVTEAVVAPKLDWSQP